MGIMFQPLISRGVASSRRKKCPGELGEEPSILALPFEAREMGRRAAKDALKSVSQIGHCMLETVSQVITPTFF